MSAEVDYIHYKCENFLNQHSIGITEKLELCRQAFLMKW